MPEISSDERGRRAFQLHREKAVDNAIEKIRESTGPAWRALSTSEIELLRYMLGESWVATGKATWERFSFSRLTRKDLEEMISLGASVRRREKTEGEAVERVIGILQRTLSPT
ncbi:MAG: hypothetical protein QHG99_01090 [Methanomicrobiales archaeon]|nr:hypothetical protein [Methanomicrobiales archaeon]